MNDDDNLCLGRSKVMSSESITALVLGATGAVGKEVVNELLRSPRIKEIVVITRRSLNLESDKIKENIIDFENLNDCKESFRGSQVAFCCLGTTRGKSGAKGFVKVDRDYVYDAAKILKEADCKHFSLVSSAGANINSTFLYMKTKGEVEKMVTELDFERLSIFRPALLICEREQTRPFEKVMQLFAKGFDWRGKLSISVETVAHAMITNSFLESNVKVEIFENSAINKLGID